MLRTFVFILPVRNELRTLPISIPTVRNHVQHMLHRLKVHSRLEAVVVARQLNLI